MQSNYIVKTKNNEILSFYYGENRSIYCSKIGADNYQTTTKVIENVIENFTTTIDSIGRIYLFCQNYDGVITICVKEKDKFIIREVLKDKIQNINNSILYPLFFGGQMSIVYNKSEQNSKNNMLMIRTSLGGDKWTNSESLDTISIVANNIFNIQKIAENHFILAYQKVGRDMEIGYKEIKDSTVKNFVTVHKTGYQIVDYSFVYFKGAIHYIYIVKSLFSSQIVYRKIDNDGSKNPVVLFEGQKIKNCSIAILENILYCKFIVGTTLYYAESEDMGESFFNISKYKKSVPADTIKVNFIGSNNDYNAINQIYTSMNNTLDIQFLNEFSSIYLHKNTMKSHKIIEKNNKNKEQFISNLGNQIQLNTEPKSVEQPKINTTLNEMDFMANFDLGKFSDMNSNQISKSEQTNTRQISNNNSKTVELEPDFMANFDLEKFSKINMEQNKSTIINRPTQPINNRDDLSRLNERLNLLTEQLNKKNSEIEKLNKTMNNKNLSTQVTQNTQTEQNKPVSQNTQIEQNKPVSQNTQTEQNKLVSQNVPISQNMPTTQSDPIAQNIPVIKVNESKKTVSTKMMKVLEKERELGSSIDRGDAKNEENLSENKG